MFGRGGGIKTVQLKYFKHQCVLKLKKHEQKYLNRDRHTLLQTAFFTKNSYIRMAVL